MQYYKPWELLPRDEERIKQQIVDAEALVKREVELLDARSHKLPREDANASPEEEPKDDSKEGINDESSGEVRQKESNDGSREQVGEPHTEPASMSNNIGTTNSPVQTPSSDQVTDEKHSQEEHNGEVVVENEEDTVIY